MARYVTLGLVLAALIAVPPALGLGFQNAMSKMLIASLFAVAFNLLAGQAGLLSFGHAAFFGIGAMATLHLMLAVEGRVLSLPTPLLPLAGGLAGLIVGAVAGYFAAMRSGVYFALVTLAIAELLHALAPHWDGVFGGEAGLSSMRMPWGGLAFGSPLEVYYLTLAWVGLSIWLLWAYTRTPFGRLTLALRDNEQRVRFLGYNAHATKVTVFAISAAFSGIAGGLLAVSNETASYALFSTHVSAQVVLHTFIGGATVFFGPIIGASVFTLFAFIVSDVTRSWLLYQGLIFVLVMLYAPLGIGGLVQVHVQHWARLRWRALAPVYGLSLVSALLIALASVVVVEALGVLFSNEYLVARRASAMGYPPFRLFGAAWQPFDPVTWLVPVALAAAGIALVPRARRGLRAAWDRIQEEARLDTWAGGTVHTKGAD